MAGVSGWSRSWFVLLPLLLSCSDNLVVRGRVPVGVAQAPLEASLGPDGETATTKQALRVSSGPVTQVLVYRNFGNADLTPVEADGRFAVDVSRSQPVGLVFLDASEAVVGTLSLGAGVTALPVSVADSTLREVDLASISFDAGVATPSSNPIEPGGALALDATERAVYELQSALFSTIVQNLDMNRDDVIDVRSPRPYWLMFEAIYGLSAVGRSAPTGGQGRPTFNELRLLLSDRQPLVMTPTPELRPPGGAVLTRVHEESRWAGDRRDETELPSYVWMAGGESSTFTAGAWSITYGADRTRLDFDVGFPLANQKHVIATDVWWESTGTTATMHWRWDLADGNPDGLDVSRLIFFVIPGLHFTDGSTSHVNTPPTSATSFTFSLEGKQPQSFSLTVRDFFGNEHVTQGPLR